MDVRIPAQVVRIGPAQDAGVAVPFERALADRLPPRPVVADAATAPVRVAVAGERLGEPLCVTVAATEDGFAGHVTRGALDAGVADVTGERERSTLPVGVG